MSVFLSYSREDRVFVSKLSNILDEYGVPHWVDFRNLTPGQDWKREISLAVKAARYVVLLVSSHSVSKRGYVQREIKEALEQFKEIPAGETFIIPARLDDSQPKDLQLADLNWFDLFPDIDQNTRLLAFHLKDLLSSEEPPESQSDDVDERIEVLKREGKYGVFPAPYRSFYDLMRVFFGQFPKDFFGNHPYAYYCRIKTDHPNLIAPEAIKAQFPDLLPIVIQNQYAALKADLEVLIVDMWFGGVRTTLKIPYDAIVDITCPQLGFSISHSPDLIPPLPDA